MEAGAPRILFATGALYVHPLRTAFELARATGCDGVELDVCPELMLHKPAVLARQAAQAGVDIRAVHPPLFPLPGWKRSETLPRLVDLALALQAPTIVVHPPKATRADGALVAGFAAQLREAQRRLQGTGVQVVLENPGFFGRTDGRLALWHLPALRSLAADCGVAMAFDTTHAGSSPCPLLESYSLVAGRLAHIHFSDLAEPPRWLDHPSLYSYFKHHQLPGAGRLPLAEFMQRLTRDGFQGDITLELSPASLRIWHLPTARRRLASAVRTTREMLKSG